MKLRRRRRVKAFPQKRSQLGGCGLPPENGVWGHAPPSAFGRAAASPQTRQMRCWLSAAQAAYHSFPSLPPTKTRSLRCTAFFPPKPLRWVSAGALLGGNKSSRFAFSAFPCGGGITTLGVRLMPLKRWTPAGHGGLFAVFMPPKNSPCVGRISTAGTHATPTPNCAHSGSHAETRGVFTT